MCFIPPLYVSTCTTFKHANGLIVVAVHMDGRNCFRRHRDHCDDVLDSLPQEDWIREVKY